MINNGTQLRDEGIKQAIDNADDTHERWSEKAYKFLTNWIKTQYEFMTEDVRLASEKEIPKPPSNRADTLVMVAVAAGGTAMDPSPWT